MAERIFLEAEEGNNFKGRYLFSGARLDVT